MSPTLELSFPQDIWQIHRVRGGQSTEKKQCSKNSEFVEKCSFGRVLLIKDTAVAAADFFESIHRLE